MPPFLPFVFFALLLPVVPRRARPLLIVLAPLVGGLFLLGAPESGAWNLQLFEYELTPVRYDRLSLLFGYLFHLAAFIAAIFSWHERDPIQQASGLLYPASAIGAIFAGDLITLFVFWELMALSSVFLVWARGTRRAYRSGLRYLIIQVLSGVFLLSGALMLVHQTGSIRFDFIGLDGLAGCLIFLAFGIKCAFPFLHNWLTDAYPEATPTGTVFLSAFTTKTAIYALARGFPGTELLVYIGVAMTCFPIFYAVIENDLRRVLAYSMINQLGFMVCGIGIGTTLAINGAVAHAFNDVIFKGLLMMSMGAVLYMTGRINGSDLGGLYKSMPITAGLCIVGAASISAFPLFSGFVSKSMVMTAALSEGYDIVWIGLLFASAGVFHHAGIKIPFFAFFAHDSGMRVTEPPANMLAAMFLAAGLCIFIGIYPTWLYSLLPFDVGYTPYDATHVIAQLQLLFFSALAFTWLKLSGIYPPELPSVNLDVEWVYRRAGPRLVGATGTLIGTVNQYARRLFLDGFRKFLEGLETHYGPASVAARRWNTAWMVLCVIAALGIYLAFLFA